MIPDLRPDHEAIVRDILDAIIPEREVWIFGSRARGDAKRHSDLDLAALGDTPLDFATLAALRDAFSESNLPYKVDLIDWATTSEGFRRIIESQRVPFPRGKRLDQAS